MGQVKPRRDGDPSHLLSFVVAFLASFFPLPSSLSPLSNTNIPAAAVCGLCGSGRRRRSARHGGGSSAADTPGARVRFPFLTPTKFIMHFCFIHKSNAKCATKFILLFSITWVHESGTRGSEESRVRGRSSPCPPAIGRGRSSGPTPERSAYTAQGERYQCLILAVRRAPAMT